MTTIFERVTQALQTLTPPVPFALGRLQTATGELPDTFLIYSLVTSTPELHLDDHEAARGYTVQISIHNRGGLVGLPEVEAAMRAAGFTLGAWRQLPQDAHSGHYHLAKDFHFFEGV